MCLSPWQETCLNATRKLPLAPLYTTKELNVIYEKAKIYSDGSHYIAIPHTTRWTKPRLKKQEKEITVDENLKPFQDKQEPMSAKNNPNLGLAVCFQANTLFRNRHIRMYYAVCAPRLSLKTRRDTCRQPKRRYFR